MKNIYYFIVLSLFTLLTSGGCKKEKCNDPICQLPPATQTGANTMGCIINGKPWLPDTRDNGGIPRLKAVNAKFWNTNDQLLFTFYRQRNPDDQGLDIFIKNFYGVGIYLMDSSSKIIGLPGSYGTLNNYFSYRDRSINKEYISNENYNGAVNIKYYDATSKVISGTFFFKAQNSSGTIDSIVVTEGRFDCKLL